MKKPVKIKNKSIEGSVLKDYQKALCEYVLNGFEANAKNIKLSYETNALSGIEKIVISDDGNGINYNNLDDTLLPDKNSSTAQFPLPAGGCSWQPDG